MKISGEKTIIVPVLLILWLSGCLSDSAIPMVMVAMTLISIRLTVLYKNVQPVFIFYIFHLSYMLLIIPYFMFGIPITPHYEFQTAMYMNPTLLIHGAFVFALYLFTDLKIPNRPVIFSKNLPKRDDAAVFLFLTGIMITILVNMMVSKVNVYSLPAEQSWGAYLENIDPSSIGSGAPEYFPCFFLTAFIFAKKRWAKRILIGIFCVFAFVSFTRGMRVSLLMLIFLFFALFYDGKIKVRYIIIMITVGMVLMQAVGYAKSGKRELAELFSVYSDKQLLTNQGEVFYTSNITVSSIIDGICGLKERAFSLLAASLQAVLPPRIELGSEGKPAIYVRELTGRAAGGGGLISVFLYFWLDYIGVIIIAMFLALVTNKAIKKPAPVLVIFIICVYSFYPRWLVYDPVNFLFRLPLYAICLYLLLMEFHRMMLKRNLTRNITQECKSLPWVM
jgi:hypothetical protein